MPYVTFFFQTKCIVILTLFHSDVAWDEGVERLWCLDVTAEVDNVLSLAGEVTELATRPLANCLVTRPRPRPPRQLAGRNMAKGRGHAA